MNDKIPLFLKIVYVLLPLWGIIWFLLYWNGSSPESDNHWAALQEAAKTK